MLKHFFIILIYIFVLSCKSDSPTSTDSSGDLEIDMISSEIEKNPSDAKLYYARGQKYYDKASYENAIIDIKKALSIDSLNPDYYHLLSDSYLDYYNSKEAVNTMMQVLAIYPERVPSLLKLAELKFILEDYDSSILTINEVVRIDPQNAEGYFMLGMNFRALGEKERAINSFQTSVEMDSGLTDAWMILGEMHEEKKDPKAIKFYESAVLSNPKSMQALHAKAFYLQNNGDVSQAQEIYRNIIVSDKTYAEAYLNSGLLYMDSDSINRAYEQFNLLTSVAPTNYLGFYYRAIVNEKRGNKDAALKDYESAYNLNKEDKRVQDALNSLKNQ